jgi:hypothetical protein
MNESGNQELRNWKPLLNWNAQKARYASGLLFPGVLALIVMCGGAAPVLMLTSPREYQVIQRISAEVGNLSIRCEVNDAGNEAVALEGRLVVKGIPKPWRALGADGTAGWEAPAGGWHRVEVRAVSGGKTLAESAVEHVAIGEVFVIAGQSNAGNHGRDKQTTKTGLVSAFDGKNWQVANDPQPGATGNEGSFAPVFGDAMAEKFGLPVGIVACAVGGTSVREWLPRGAKFPNPPTIVANVEEVKDGQWQSKGGIYDAFVARMKGLGSGRSFRAVLWHQGESDANQADAARTLAGKLYTRYLEEVIRTTRADLGWDVPWFVAQASYHTPADPRSEDIREAQAALWRAGVALEGPDTDKLKSEFRASNGRGVHFNGAGLREHGRLWFEKVGPWLERQLAAEETK